MSVVSRPVRSEQPLVALMLNVNQARAHVAVGRAREAGSSMRDDQQHRNGLLLTALEAYAEAACSAGAPLPYRYRDEMRLLRSLYPGIVSGSGGAGGQQPER
jgi:hypothetical protein